MKDLRAILARAGVIPVIRLEDETAAAPLAGALLAGGVAAAEITFRTLAAAKAIENIAKAEPDMFVCAGTVLTVEQARQAVESGAKAIVSPGTSPKVVEWCLAHDIPVCPGCATPTEVEAALVMGLSTLKLFPAEAIGGVKLLKALYGPYSHVQFMPTGGISPNNLKDYLLQPNVIACGGSWLCPEKAVASGDWGQVTALAQACTQLVAKIRNAPANR